MQNGLYAYQEEDSYMNPSNVSKINQSGFYNDQNHMLIGDYETIN